MLKTITHHINLIRHALRDVGVSEKRSDRWPTIEKHFREANPTCAACGGEDRLNVHHIKPFHLFPELELDPNNLITLCMGKLECHIKLGHCGSFSRYNVAVRKDAKEALENPKDFDQIVKRAALEAKKN